MRFPMTAVSVLAVAGGMLLGAGVAHAQTTWYVDDEESAGNGCTSWADACPELQTALSLAAAGDQIWVAVGTYKPDYDVDTGQHTGNRAASFRLINNVAIYGGFDATEALLEDRAGLFAQTILSGELPGSSESEGGGSENSYHVVKGSLIDETAILDGFSITAGNADGSFPNDHGGGMFNDASSPTVSNCIFSANSAEQGGGMVNFFNSSPMVSHCTFSANSAERGGGMYNVSNSIPTVSHCTFSANNAERGGGMSNIVASPTVSDCTFSANNAQLGGGMYSANSSPTVSNCTFSRNGAQLGGGMHNFNGSLTVSNCTFTENSAQLGGGVYNEGGSPTVTHCTFNGNSAMGSGGGMISASSSPIVINCAFSNNSADHNGGGMHSLFSSPMVINCTFSGNLATGDGGGMSSDGGSAPTVTHCTFSGNSASSGGGMSAASLSSATVSNCILWDDSPDEIVDNAGAVTTVLYSDVQGGWMGPGNIDADPLFVDADGLDDIPGTRDDNLRLSSGSPAIDAADNTAVPADTADLDNDGDTDEPIPVDLDGNPRFVEDAGTPDTGNPDGINPIVDMGAYEFQGVRVLSVDIKPGACPNPFNRHSNGVLPVALVGTDDFDPTEVDLSTLQLSRADGVGGSVAPNEGPPGPHSVVEDVASPFEGAPCECHDLGGDGLDDLSMKFRTDEMVEALELDALPGGSVVELVLSGSLLDGTPFAASDCIVILPPGDTSPANAHVESNVVDTFVEVRPLDLNFDDDGFADFSRSYYGGTAMTLTAPVQSAGRRFVRWLLDGTPQPIGMRTIEVTVSEDTTIKAAYARPARTTPEHQAEPDAPLE